MALRRASHVSSFDHVLEGDGQRHFLDRPQLFGMDSLEPSADRLVDSVVLPAHRFFLSFGFSFRLGLLPFHPKNAAMMP